MAVMVLSLAVIPIGIVVSALWDSSLRRRSRFWLRFTTLVACMLAPWMVGLTGAAGERTSVALLWTGFIWSLLLSAVAPLLLFRRPGLKRGGSDDSGPGPEDDRQPPRPPIGGIPLPNSEQPAARSRGAHSGRRGARQRRPRREPVATRHRA